MTHPRILVTGATGKTGGQVARQLLAAGYPVRAFVRREDGRSALLRTAGAEIVAGDLFDPQQLLDATQGVRRGYFLPPFDPYMIQSDRGVFELGGPTNDVLVTTGREPETFETIVRRYAARPESQRSFRNFARGVVGFMSVPLRPGLDPQRFHRTLWLPQPKNPQLSADSAFWRHEHGIAPAPMIVPPAQGNAVPVPQAA